MKTQNPSRNPITRLLRSPLLAPFNDTDLLDQWVGSIQPSWSLSRIRATVVEVIDQTADTRSFRMRPNRRWRGHQAGQHALISIEINGRRLQRAYSLSSAPGAEEVEITVKRQPGGLVSNWLHDNLETGDVIDMEAATGDFVLPAALPPRLLLLTAGSGITPAMSLLRELSARQHPGEVTLVHSCRNPADFIFHAELVEMATTWPALRLLPQYTATSGRLNPESLLQLIPDHAERETYVCGPAGFIDGITAVWARAGLSSRLHSERFGAPTPVLDADSAATVDVLCSKSERSFEANGQRSLLDQAEGAGLNPRYGCRIGICQSCKCRKTDGTVQNLLTGQVSSEPNEMIQLCISAPRGNVTLDI